ncbi:c-type cytochrome [Shimia sp.]|uniref:c-type cytochrome n=1 Tax=Shimia sp. TaxID=1954381 RepID=UPI003B8D9CB1
MSRSLPRLVALCVIAVGAAAWLLLGRETGADAADISLPYSRAENTTRGALIYAENCADCHGANLEGEANWRQMGADGRMPAPPHNQSGHTWHHPDTLLFAITKYGSETVVGQGYESNMPGFEGNLSDQDIVDVLAFIKSTWPEDVIQRHDQINAQSRP